MFRFRFMGSQLPIDLLSKTIPRRPSDVNLRLPAVRILFINGITFLRGKSLLQIKRAQPRDRVRANIQFLLKILFDRSPIGVDLIKQLGEGRSPGRRIQLRRFSLTRTDRIGGHWVVRILGEVEIRTLVLRMPIQRRQVVVLKDDLTRNTKRRKGQRGGNTGAILTCRAVVDDRAECESSSRKMVRYCGFITVSKST